MEREKTQLEQEYDTLSMRVAVKQMDYEEADERLKEANERVDRIEAYIKTQSDTLVDLEEKATKLERKAEIAEMVYEMARGSGGNETLRDKLIDGMYENEQLKTENSKLRETLNKAYDFMKQFVVDGRNLLEKFLESIGQVVEKVGWGAAGTVLLIKKWNQEILRNTTKYHKIILKIQNICAIILILY